jgi:hypothetical protein
MSSGMSSNDRTALSEAISIIQTRTKGMAQVNDDANDRIKVAGKSRLQIIDEAKSIVLEYFEIYDDLTKSIHVTVKRKPNGTRFNNTDLKVINNSRWDIELGSCAFFLPDNLDTAVSIIPLGNRDVKGGELTYIDGYCRGTTFKDNQECTQIQLSILGRIPNSRKFGEKWDGNQDIDEWTIGDQTLFSVHPVYNSFLQHIGYARNSNR